MSYFCIPSLGPTASGPVETCKGGPAWVWFSGTASWLACCGRVCWVVVGHSVASGGIEVPVSLLLLMLLDDILNLC